MNVEIFSQWLCRQGFQVYQTESSFWYTAGPRTLQAFPYHWLIKPSEEELRKLFFSKGILSLRYSTPLDANEGKVSYHVELCRPYSLDLLKPQARNGVKRGQGCFLVERIPFRRLAEEGWLLQQDTLERQDRLGSMKQETWQRLCLAADDLPGFEAWGAIANGELAGALFTAQIGDVICVPYALSRTQYLHEHVNNVLFFHTCANILARKDISRIFFTVQSLDAPESVDEFKFRMSLIPRPVRQRVVLNPLATPLATSSGYSLISRLVKRYPTSNFLAKTEGMIRFSRLGKLPLDEQQWPSCVEPYRDSARNLPTSSPDNGRNVTKFPTLAALRREE
jgi:hypothetical protein